MTKRVTGITLFVMLLFTFSDAMYAGPIVGFSLGGINTTTHVETFNFDFVTPYAGGPYNEIESVFDDVLIDTNFTGQSTLVPLGSTGFIMNTYDTGVLVPAVGIGKPCTTPAFVYVCTSPDVGALGPLSYLSNASGTLEVKGSFTVTPGGQFTLIGSAELFSAPEPCTLTLLGPVILVLARRLQRACGRERR